MAADLERTFGARFVALVASGPRASVAFAEHISAGDLRALGAAAATWHREDLDTPLLITTDEFRRSLDAFPVEYQALLDRHVVIAGRPPFDGVEIDGALLRRACEIQAKSHLIHLRQGWINSDGDDLQIADLLVQSAEPLRALLADVARLHGSHDDDQALAGARAAGIDAALVEAILALSATPAQARRLVTRMPEYVDAAEQLWNFVDTWTS
jgi:hypothetical protein